LKPSDHPARFMQKVMDTASGVFWPGLRGDLLLLSFHQSPYQ
jgi:hypothetical protein